MITLSEEIDVAASIEEAFAFVADFSSVQEWDPQVSDARRISNGPIGLGSRFAVVFRFGPRTLDLTYEISEFEPPRKITLRGVGQSFSGEDRISFAVKGQRTRIRYEADLEFPGSTGLLRTAFEKILQPLGRNAVNGLKRCLDDKGNEQEKSNFFETVSDRLVVPGMLGFSDLGFKARRKRFPPIDSRLDGKTVVITGASAGLGRAATYALADLGARIGMVGRSEEQLKFLTDDLEKRCGRQDFHAFCTDLSESSNVYALGDELKNRYTKIDVLIHNAGILQGDYETTSSGLEKSVAVNLLAPFLLTTELSSHLKAAEASRVILVSSGGMYPVKFDVKQLSAKKTTFDGVKVYAMAKRAQIMLCEHWAQKFAQHGIVVHVMHPGWAETPGVEKSLPKFYRLTRPILRSPEHGADTIVWLAAAKMPGNCSGKFWHDRRSRDPYLIPGTRPTKNGIKQLLNFLEKHKRS